MHYYERFQKRATREKMPQPADKKKKIIFQRASWRLEQWDQPSEDLIDLLASTIWGTPGKTLYQHLDTRERIKQLQHPIFLQLRKGERLKAGLALCGRNLLGDTPVKQAFYLRYLSVVEALRNKKAPQKIRKANRVSDGILKRQLNRLFSSPNLGDPSETGQAVYYAYVESENIRSRQFCEGLGFQQVRSFSTLSFSRFSPQPSAFVHEVEKADQAEILEALQHHYRHHHFFFTDHAFLDDRYYFFRKEGKILAGLRATPVRWVVKNLPGLSGKLLIKVLPHLPGLSSLFNPKDFRFLAFDAFFYPPGQMDVLFELFEAVLARLQFHTALFWMDRDDPDYELLFRSGKLGLLHRFSSDTYSNVLIRTVNLPPEALSIFRKAPVYISALDVT